MALIQCRFTSETLALATSATVILPQRREQNKLHKTLYLLHGLSDDDSIWLRNTSIERYASSYGIAVVMPQAHRSFYTDMDGGLLYWTFLSEELPRVARDMFPLSDAREDNFVAGLSMGGYGAFKWALRRPEFFAAAASMSGALNMGGSTSDLALRIDREMRLIFGEAKAATGENDLLWLLERQAGSDREIPALYQCCGTEDYLYQDNLIFRDACRKAGLQLTYEEGPGNHTWEYWDARIQDVLAWLPLR